jgi:hypothetical protein
MAGTFINLKPCVPERGVIGCRCPVPVQEKKQQTHYPPEEKVALLRRHLLDKESISKSCDEATECLRLLFRTVGRWLTRRWRQPFQSLIADVRDLILLEELFVALEL